MHGYKYKTPEELWDRCPKKLIVYVMEGISMVTKKGAGNPYVKLIYDKQKVKTSSLKNTEDATWKEMFLFEVLDEPHELILEVYNKQSLSDKLIGQCKVCIPNELKTETVIDQWFDLDLPENLKAKHKDVLDEIIGNVHLRLYYSVDKETPPAVPDNQKFKFSYQKYLKKMKTGDLILYDGIGFMDSVTKIYSGSQYSRIGIILKLHNRFTRKMELYVAEMTRNIGNFLDAFKLTSEPGLNIFRFKERMHFFNCTSIWWSPLKTPVDIAGEQNMIEWMTGVSSNTIKMDELPPLPEEISRFFDDLDIQISKVPNGLQEMHSAFIVIQALRLSGKRYPFDQRYHPPVQVLVNDYFDAPVLIRERVGESGSEVATLSLSRAERRLTVLGQRGSTPGPNRGRAISSLDKTKNDIDRNGNKHKRQNSHRKTVSNIEFDRQHESNARNKKKPNKKHSRVFSDGNQLENIKEDDESQNNKGDIKNEPLSTVSPSNEALDNAKKENDTPSPSKADASKSDTSERRSQDKDETKGESKPVNEQITQVRKNTRIRPPSETLDSAQIEAFKLESKPSGINLNNDAPRSPTKVENTPPETPTNEQTTTNAVKTNSTSESSVNVDQKKKNDVVKTEEKQPESPVEKKIPDGVNEKKKKKKSNSDGSGEKKKKKKKQKSQDVPKKEKKASKKKINLQGKVLFDFIAENEGEIGCKKGDIVDIVDHETDPDWIIVKVNGKHGCVPRTFVEF